MNKRLLAPLSLAAAAVLGFAPSSASAAEDASCGQPAVPAVYSQVDHPAVVTTIGEVTHVEWLWQRSIPTTEFEYARTVTPAQGTWSWSRQVEAIERAWVQTVIDRAFVPAIPEVGHEETQVVTPAVTRTEAEFVHQQSGRTRWEIAGWNADEGGKGWSPTGATRVIEVTPAVTKTVWIVDQAAVPAVSELSHVEKTWVADGTSGPAGSTSTDETRVVSTSTETAELAAGDEPAGAGWVKGDFTQTAAAIIDSVWAGTAPDGYDPTGAERAGTPTVEQTDVVSAAAPAGDGWAQVDGSGVTVVDAASHDVETAAAWTEMVLVTPEFPATAACVDDPDDTDDPDDDGTDDDTDIENVVDTGDDLGDVDGLGDEVPGEVLGAAETQSDAVLPATGAVVEPWLLALGAGSVFAGVGVLYRGRHRKS
ncbi:LPXTG cell wall anchor domain-containing protein [Nocardioides sp. WS12]|uniref:LPXTG cell wall anchor domain-containing protein n=1 Tax=Nocardioides sp. WS12 TaxID=2486272 RepID=UPI0015FAD34D|nr:LPXTG cell wall anchor domain-containing protein [Nocardioides sp. WS12]